MTKKLTNIVSFLILFVMVLNIGVEAYAYDTIADLKVENQEERPGDTSPSDEAEETEEPEEVDLSEREEEIEEPEKIEEPEEVDLSEGEEIEYEGEAFIESISINAISTGPTAIFDFYINDAKLETQIVKDGEKLVEPSTPEALEGQKFIGWYIEGEDTPINFDNPVTVEESETFKVDARFTNINYVHFVYDGNVIATKEVDPNGNVYPSDVPLVVNKPGKAFSHWSTSENGTEFDFETPITQDTTLYAVLVDRWTVTFDTQGGTTVLPKHVVDRETLGEVAVPIKAGYKFSGWNTQADGNGDTFTASSNITANVKLYAIWEAKTDTQYTVVYWQENANDDKYSYVESYIGEGTTDSPATYENKTYYGFTLDTDKTSAANVNISGDGTTVRNVYYKRNRYKLECRSKYNNNRLKTFNNIKQGADTSPWWNEAVETYSNYTWFVSANSNIFYTLAPNMPDKDLTVYGEQAGNTNYIIFYLEDVAGNRKVREPYYFTGDMIYLTSEDYIGILGFTVKSNPEDGSQNPVYNYNTRRFEWKIYYSRNKYNITFHKNDNTGNKTITDIPYEADISNKALQDYIVDSTTRSDGYIFKGWYDNEATAGEPYNFDGKKMPASNLILYAKWIPPVHTVKYYLTPDTGGDYRTVDNIPHGDSITEKDLEGKIIPNGLTENDFLGWYWFVGGVFVPYDFSTPINNNDIVLHPVWKGLTYGVTYDSNGASGEVPIDNNKYILGAAAKILSPTNLTPPSDKVFIGWKEVNSDRIYHPNDKLSIAGNMILIAQWGNKVPKTSLTYYGNGGVDVDNNEEITIPLMNNEKHTVKPSNTFTRERYNFVKWNTNDDGSGDSFQPGAEIIVDNKGSNELYAIWELRKDISYTVNYLEKDTYKVLSEQKVVEGQIFGTEVTESAIDIVGYNKVDPTEATNTLKAENNIINFYYEKDESKWHTVKFEAGANGKLKEDGQVEFTDILNGTSWEAAITVPEAVANPGYRFKEWTPSFPETVTQSVTYTANFEIDETQKDFEYQIDYFIKGTESKVPGIEPNPVTGKGYIGETIEIDHPEVNTGYKVMENQPKSLEVLEDNSAIAIVYYEARTDISYTVNYLEQGTNKVLSKQKIVTGKTYGTKVTEEAITITGYNKIAPTTVTITLKAENNIITFYYKVKSKPEPEPELEPEPEPIDPPPYVPYYPLKEDNIVIVGDEEVPMGLPDKLNMEEHYQYIQGYPDNTVQPENYITREEVTAVFFRLLTPKYRDSVRTMSHNFPDVKEGRWSTKHIATLANAKIVEGYEDGTFRTDQYITRAELATIASRFDNLSPFTSNKFSDIKNHWANKYINSAAEKGWVNGYPDGTFKPDQYITRAEFVTLVNNVLNRRVHKEDILPEAKSFPDLIKTKWYYEAMQEAINSHHYERQEDGYEKWLDIYYPDPEM